MDTSLDNANNPFANSNGSDNKTITTTASPPPPTLQATIDTDSLKTDAFLLNLSTENNYKQISSGGGDVDDLLSSRTNDFYQNLEKSNGKRPASTFDDDDDDGDDLEQNNDNIIDIENERDEDDNDDDVDDLGPETDVDTADVLSPSMITAKALADGIMNNNPEGSFNPFVEKEEVEKAALEIHHDLQKQISEDDDEDQDEVIDRKTPVTPPIVQSEKTDVPANVPVHDVGGSLEENVADSGDDSEDEWNYIKGDDADKENLNPVQPEQEVAASIEEDPDNMSQLNPNAAEFVPVSPTRSIPSPACQALINDPVISQSPKRAADIDISVPNQKDFENEVKSRPSDVGKCDTNGHQIINDNDEPQSPTQELENLLNGKNIDEIPEFQPTSVLTPTKLSNDEFHFGPNATPFTPGKLLDQSVTALSTRAVYGDESTATIQSFDESAFGQDNIDFTSSTLLNNKESDPMSMSFYQEKTDVTIDELNRVQTLPEDLDDFLNKPDETTQQQFDNTVITKTEQSDQIINFDNDERIVQTTDLDKIVDYEKDIASPVDNDMFDVCELPKSPDLISNEIVEKENEEDKEKIVEKGMVEEKDKEEEKEIAEEKELIEETVNEADVEAICDRIAKSPEFMAVSPSPEPIQNNLQQNQDNHLVHLETDHAVVVEEENQPQSQQHQLLLDDLVEHKSPTPEPEVEIVQVQDPATMSPLPPTHEQLSSPEPPVVETPASQVEIVTSPEPTLEENHHYTHEETKVLCSADSSTDIENKEDSAIGSPIDDITSSVKDTTSPIVMSPIPDQEIVPVSEQETAPVGESSPIIDEKQSEEVLVPEICAFSPPESVATAEVNSFLERSEISDVHSPLVASPVAVAPLTNDGNDEPPVVSEPANILDLDHPLSKCVFPLPTEHKEIAIIKTEEEVTDDNKVEDNKKLEQDSSVVVEEIVEQKTEQTENAAPEVAATTAAAAVGAAVAVAATATAVTAATVVEKKATDKTKTIAKKAPTATKTTPSKLTAAMSKPKPTTPTTKPTTARTTAAKSTTSVASPKPTAATKTNVNKLATAKPKPASSPSAPNKTGIDKKPMTNGDVKSARSAIAIKKTDSTTTTTKPSSSRSVASTLNKTSPTKNRVAATQPAKVSSSTTTSKISSTTTSATSRISSTTTSATTKPRPTTLAPKTTSTTKPSSLSAISKTTATKTTSSTRTALSSPRAPRPTTATTTATTKPRVPLAKTITKTSADAEKQNKESANKLTASRSSTTTTTRTTGKTPTSTLKKTEIKNSGTTKTTVTKTTTVTGKKPNEIARNLKTTTTKTTKIEKPIQNGISSVVTEQIIVNNDNEPQLVKDNSPIDNKLMVEATNHATD